jgi:nucleosome binding factor SPN SPT16 subunit
VDNLKAGVILASIGLRYKNYCTSMGRTFMISPSKVCDPHGTSRGTILTCLQKQEANYSILLEARTEALKVLKDGTTMKDVYTKVQSFVAGKSGTLGESLGKNIGFSVSCSGYSCVYMAKANADWYRIQGLELCSRTEEYEDTAGEYDNNTYAILLRFDGIKVRGEVGQM